MFTECQNIKMLNEMAYGLSHNFSVYWFWSTCGSTFEVFWFVDLVFKIFHLSLNVHTPIFNNNVLQLCRKGDTKVWGTIN